MVFGMSSGDGGASAAKAAKNDARDEGKASVRQWWVTLQRQLADGEKDNKFLQDTDNKLQPYLDIIFFRYWNLEQARSEDQERYIPVEQSLRLFDDLVRGNEDLAIPALKDYLTYRMTSGAADNEAVSAKKTAFVEDSKKTAMEKFDKDRADEISSQFEDESAKATKSNSPTALEKAIGKAKLNGVDVSKADETLKELKDATEKKAEEKANAPVEKAKKAVESAKDDGKAAAEAKVTKAEAGATAEKQKNTEAAEKAAADVKGALEEAEKDKKEADDTRKEAEKQAEKDGSDKFGDNYKKAVDKTVQKIEDAYRKTVFINRQAALAAFLVSTTEGVSKEEGRTITQNDLNRMMNLTESEKFDAFSTALGFNRDSFDAALSEMEEEEAKEGSDDGFVKVEEAKK